MSVWGAYRVTGIAYCLGLSFSLMSTFEVGVIPGLQIRKLISTAWSDCQGCGTSLWSSG